MLSENSVERSKRMIRDLDAEIEFLRGCAVDAANNIAELTAQLAKEQENLDKIEDQKLDCIYTKLALKKFIESGGGLDMLVP